MQAFLFSANGGRRLWGVGGSTAVVAGADRGGLAAGHSRCSPAQETTRRLARATDLS